MTFVPATTWSPDDHRRHALCSALAMWAPDLSRLVSRHPDHRRVLRESLEETPTTLDRLLWDELEGRESVIRRASGQARSARPPTAHPRTAPSYWLRRRRLALHAELQTLVGVLPDLWRVLMDRKPETVEAFAIRVGLACLALGEAAENPAADDGLDDQTRRRVRRIGSTLDPVQLDPALVSAWSTAFAKQSSRSGVDKALRALGMSVLSGLFQRLPAATRSAMGRHFQSSLCGSLAAGRPLRPVTGVEAELLEGLFVRLFGHADEASPWPSSSAFGSGSATDLATDLPDTKGSA